MDLHVTKSCSNKEIWKMCFSAEEMMVCLFDRLSHILGVHSCRLVMIL